MSSRPSAHSIPSAGPALSDVLAHGVEPAGLPPTDESTGRADDSPASARNLNAPPEWFQRKKAASGLSSHTEPMAEPAGNSSENASPTAALIQVPADKEHCLSWKQWLLAWLLGAAGTSYGISLLLHAGVLGVLSVMVVSQFARNESVSVIVTEAEALPFNVSDSVEVAFEPPAAERVESQFQKLPVDPLGTLLSGDAAFNVAQSDGDGENTGSSDEGFGFMFSMPEGGKVVTKGSFSAWTVPTDPSPGQDYKIVIRVRLPENTNRYRVSDLSGEVTGTDGYQHKIPYDPLKRGATVTERGDRLVPIRPSDSLKIVDGHVQLIVNVPGASSLTRDTIQVRSKLLKEEQKLEIVF